MDDPLPELGGVPKSWEADVEAPVSWWNGRERTCLLALNGARAQFTRDIILRARRHVRLLSDSQKNHIVSKYEDDSKQSNLSFLKDMKEIQEYKKRISSDNKTLLDIDEKLEILMNGLRSEDIFQIAMFYYELDETDQANPSKMRPFLLRHNAYLAELSSDPKKCIAMGVRPDRIGKAILSERQIDKVLVLLGVTERDGRVRHRAAFDQTVLGSLFADIMSREQCRLSIVLLEDFGLLERHKLTSVEVVSTGELENCFRSYLQKLLVDLDAMK